jgi:hypothetical protein
LFLDGWLAVGALALTYRQAAVAVFSGLNKIHQERAVGKSLNNNPALRRVLVLVAIQVLALLSIGWGFAVWILS